MLEKWPAVVTAAIFLTVSAGFQRQQNTDCTLPCDCSSRELERCDSGVKDDCDCCQHCLKQRQRVLAGAGVGETCNVSAPCDKGRGLTCHYDSQKDSNICKEMGRRPCLVNNYTYQDAKTFMLDCRTQCICQNGTYACASLCPQENIFPLSNCLHPRLVEIPGQCCREWMCDSHTAQRPPECLPNFSQWTSCSIECGLGFSHRVSNLNPQCVLKNETRLCHLRPCTAPVPLLKSRTHHHIRKGHECRATQKVPGPVWLTFGRCRSRKKYRPRTCGECPGKCCVPELSTTIKVEFYCFEQHSFNATLEGTSFTKLVSESDRLSGSYYSALIDVEWILKCRCSSCRE